MFPQHGLPSSSVFFAKSHGYPFNKNLSQIMCESQKLCLRVHKRACELNKHVPHRNGQQSKQCLFKAQKGVQFVYTWVQAPWQPFLSLRWQGWPHRCSAGLHLDNRRISVYYESHSQASNHTSALRYVQLFEVKIS